MERHYDFYESFSLVAARMTALAISETPTSIIIVAQNTNHVVVSIRNVLIRWLAPNQKTRFEAVSAFLLTGEWATNLRARTAIW